MKLIEYRFEDCKLNTYRDVAERIARFFLDKDDIDLSMMFVERMGAEHVTHLKMDIARLADILEQSIFTSCLLENIDYSKLVSVRSNKTRRFVAVELDAVIRICMAHGDVAPDFTDIKPEIYDVSELLIETDFFDYI